MEALSASLQQVITLLKTKMESRRALKLLTAFAARDHHFWQEAKMGQIRKTLKAFKAVQISTESNARVSEKIFALFCQKKFPSSLSKGSTFVQSIIAKRNVAAKIILLQSTPSTTEALLLFSGSIA